MFQKIGEIRRFFGTPFKYFLVSRSPEKLQVAAKEIEETFDVKTKILAIDFTKDKDIQERVEAEIRDLNIGVLVNNVGVSYDHPEYFLQIGIVNVKVLKIFTKSKKYLPCTGCS